MNNKIAIAVVVIVLVVLGGVYVASRSDSKTNIETVETSGGASSSSSGASQTPVAEPEMVTTPPAAAVPPANQVTPPAVATPPPAPSTGEKTYTAAEVAKNNSESSCWTIVRGEVFDVTSFMTKHPGGKANILKLCGIDGTSLFEGKHGGQSAPEMRLDGLKIGNLAK